MPGFISPGIRLYGNSETGKVCTLRESESNGFVKLHKRKF